MVDGQAAKSGVGFSETAQIPDFSLAALPGGLLAGSDVPSPAAVTRWRLAGIDLVAGFIIGMLYGTAGAQITAGGDRHHQVNAAIAGVVNILVKSGIE